MVLLVNGRHVRLNWRWLGTSHAVVVTADRRVEATAYRSGLVKNGTMFHHEERKVGRDVTYRSRFASICPDLLGAARTDARVQDVVSGYPMDVK